MKKFAELIGWRQTTTSIPLFSRPTKTSLGYLVVIGLAIGVAVKLF